MYLAYRDTAPRREGSLFEYRYRIRCSPVQIGRGWGGGVPADRSLHRNPLPALSRFSPPCSPTSKLSTLSFTRRSELIKKIYAAVALWATIGVSGIRGLRTLAHSSAETLGRNLDLNNLYYLHKHTLPLQLYSHFKSNPPHSAAAASR